MKEGRGVMCVSGCGVCVYVCVAHRWLGRRRGMVSAKGECKHVQGESKDQIQN